MVPRVSPSSLPAGRHVLAELTGVDAALLDDVDALSSLLTAALVAAGAHVRQLIAETFAPQGVTVVALLAESHASIHTWPEHGTAHVDMFTCGDAADPVHAIDLLAADVGAQAVHREVVDRGPGARSVRERIAPGLTRRWELGSVYHAARTPFQRVLVAQTAHGATLFCDDERQSAADTQLVYHEALFVPAALLAARLERVMVIGSSEGVVSQLAVAAGARMVDHVDIDPDCVRICSEHLPYGYTPAELATAEADAGPVRVHYMDGAQFVATCEQRYDVIVIDLPDERPEEPEAQINRLYAEPFLRRCVALLTDGGVVVAQAGSPTMWRDATLRDAWSRFHTVFGQVVPYLSNEHEWAFLIGRRDARPDPAAEMIERLAEWPTAPDSIDAAALRSRTVAPLRLRR